MAHRGKTSSILAVIAGLLCLTYANAQGFKQGTCPIDSRRHCPSTEVHTCLVDSDCTGNQKCCLDSCKIYGCKEATGRSRFKQGTCPIDSRRHCPSAEVHTCLEDSDCSGNQKCCQDSCKIYGCKEATGRSPTCNIGVDLGIIVDSSSTMTANNFLRVKSFLISLLNEFDVREGGTHVALIVFGDNPRLVFNFEGLQGDGVIKSNIAKQIARIPPVSGSNRLDLALLMARNEMFSIYGGTRRNAPRILLVVTDGIGARGTNTKLLRSIVEESNELKQNGVEIFVVAAGNKIELSNLRKISSGPEKIFHSEDFNDLASAFHEVAVRSCKACSDAVDVGFAIPANSFAQFGDLRDFMKRTLDYFVLGNKNVQIGLIVYRSEADVLVKFDQVHDLDQLKEIVESISFVNRGDKNNLDVVLRTAADQLFTLRNGLRQEAAKKLILVAERPLHGNRNTINKYAEQLKYLGVDIIGVAYGPYVDRQAVKSISSFPALENYKEASTITDLLRRLPRAVVESTCKGKKGKCPFNNVPRNCPSQIVHECHVDEQCPNGGKCCQIKCTRICSKPVKGCFKPLEIAFLVDNSFYVRHEETRRVKDFMKEMATRFGISETGTRFSIVNYNSGATVVLRFNDNINTRQVIDKIERLNKVGQRERRLDRGLQLIKSDVFSLKGGIRQGVPRVLIVLSGGPPTASSGVLKSLSSSFKNTASVWAVGSGPSSATGYLNDIASNGRQSLKTLLFENLFPLVSEITEEVCSDKPGQCPRPATPSVCVTQDPDCSSDFECPGFSKCCHDGCSRTCLSLSSECKKPLDLAIVMESSNNIGSKNFLMVKKFAKDLVKALNVDNSQTEIAIITYGDAVESNLEFITLRGILNKEVNILRTIDRSYFSGGSNHAAYKALEHAFITTFGDKGGSRKDAVKGLVFISDGRLRLSTQKIYNAAALLKQAGVAIYPVAASRRPNLDALEVIASDSSNEHVYLATSLPAIIQYVHQISKEACKAEAPPKELKLIKGPKGERGSPGKKGVAGLPGIPGAAGGSGLLGPNGNVGADGVQGRPGGRGNKGPPGPPGKLYIQMSRRDRNGQMRTVSLPPIGNAGPQGQSGRPGKRGSQGTDGFRGPRGKTGDIGYSGYPGKRGEPGERGTKGDTGRHGRPGRRGRQGKRGKAGDVGPPGPPSPKGYKGHKGYKGQPGLYGEPGNRGLTGLAGKRGGRGEKGAKGTLGQYGRKGLSGVLGIRGSKGPNGGPGPKGDRGNFGGVGVMGDRGNKGPPGPLGPPGLRGVPGETGSAGFAGENGVPGSNGKKGDIGKGGPKGSVGDPGPLGTSGVGGVPALQGEPGAFGPTGFKGKQGIQGNIGGTGTQGDKGIQGNFGAPGMDGDIGPNGKKGIEGDNGPLGPPGIEGQRGIQGSRGPVGRDGPLGQQGKPGQRGKPGKSGKKGDTGQIGKVGSIGDTGKQGSKGRSGPPGRDGKSGTMGAPGDNGHTGPIGEKGSKGHIGIKGKIGLKGALGPQGKQGLLGPFGGKGDKGLRGLKGENGKAGFVGATGEPGLRGAGGDAGIPGEQGPPGLQGEKGHKGREGDKGPLGNAGIKGTHGGKGAVGDKGDPGEIGEEGVKGITGVGGERGKRGTTGPHGPLGSTGSSGEPGVAGIEGYSGRLGPPGEKGEKGDSGIQGTDGTPGASGDHGVNGVRGNLGSQGQRGEKGEDGIPGIVGEPGGGGVPGRKGLAGSPGPFGEPGIAGGTGLPGAKGEVGTRGIKGDTGIPGGEGIRGYIGQPGIPGPSGLPGLRGERGSPGVRGTEGAVGKLGYQGPMGPRGDQGRVGNAGVEGKKGPVGDAGGLGRKGMVGSKGEPGVRGDTGEDGEVGAKGRNGFLGSAGVKGPVGAQGDMGAWGHSGVAGPQGSAGVRGIPGKPGKIGGYGDPGLQGEDGIPGGPGGLGHRGEAGKPGKRGEPGYRGYKGDVGGIGLRGNQAAPGERGVIGIPGRTGPKGDPGEKGDPGPTGFVGLTGPRGNHGWKGQGGWPGTKGGHGKKGDVGDPGPSGFLGPSGPRGEKGNDGKIGSIGQKGHPGDIGYSGRLGPMGKIGARGFTGSSGVTGVDGDPGRKGDLGKQGPAGPPGPPGVIEDLSAPRNAPGTSRPTNRERALSYYNSDKQFEIIKKFNKVNKQVALMRKPSGTKTSPAVTCKNLFNDYPHFQSGDYWLDPNEGAPEDAVLVFCDSARMLSCISPLSPKTKVKQWFSGGDRYLWFREDLDENFKFRYSVESSQLTFLQLFSDNVHQNLTYYCVKSAAWADKDGDLTRSIKILGDNEREYKATTPRKHRPILLTDFCKLKDDKERKTIITMVTRNTVRLPIRDVAIYDAGDEGEQFGLELGPVCFN